MMMSGSCRIRALRPSAKPSSTVGCTWVWLKAGSIISIGSSTVQTLTSSVASFLSVEYSVVVLPEPVGPVTKMMPCGRVISSPQRLASSFEKPKASKFLSAAPGSKIRITSFSPKAVGKEDRRISTSDPPLGPPSGRRVLMRPSCGLRRSITSIRPSSLMRAVMASITAWGTWCTVCNTPSMRKRTAPVSRRGSRWMSLARWSKAYCHNQSTSCTTPWSLASRLSRLFRSTSCSKLAAAEEFSLVLRATRTLVAS